MQAESSSNCLSQYDMDFDDVSLEFLFTELSSGLTFANVALSAQPGDTEKVKRNRHNARVAYDSILRFQPRVNMLDADKTRLAEGLKELKELLRLLGEKF